MGLPHCVEPLALNLIALTLWEEGGAARGEQWRFRRKKQCSTTVVVCQGVYTRCGVRVQECEHEGYVSFKVSFTLLSKSETADEGVNPLLWGVFSRFALGCIKFCVIYTLP